MENQLDSVTEKPIYFLRLQGLACDWSKHNKHSRNILSVHGFLRLSVRNGPFCFIFIFLEEGGGGKYEKNSCTTFTEEIQIVHNGTKQKIYIAN